MKTSEIIVAGIAGTTAFTLFSYLISKATGKNFKEPELIGKMIDRSPTPVKHENAQFTGWVTHYLIGISFAAAYRELIHVTGIKPTVANGIITGAVSGFPAALTWDTSLKVHPAPPRKRSVDYYMQLFFGHALFGAAAFFVFAAFKKKTNDKKESVKSLDPAETKLSSYATAGS